MTDEARQPLKSPPRTGFYRRGGDRRVRVATRTSSRSVATTRRRVTGRFTAWPDWQPAAVLGAMVTFYWAMFGFLVYRQHSNFGTFGYDIGIHDQGIWLTSRGISPFVTVRGLDYFAHHVNLISLVFVPFYWLGAGPHLLIVVHTGAVAAGAIPLWLLTRDRIGSPWLALVVPIAYLSYPAVQWVTWWAYHPDSLAITPLLFAWWFASRRRWGWFTVAVLVALSCKEDAALSVLMMGLVVAFWRLPSAPDQPSKSDDGELSWRRPVAKVGRWWGRDQVRRRGLTTSFAGLAWYLICTKVIIPWRNHGNPPFYESFFPLLGRTLPGILYNAVRHPSRVAHLAWISDRRTYYVQMFAPVAALPILALPIFLIGGPQFGVDITAQEVQGATIKSQYASLVIVGVFLATAEALGFIKRRRPAILPAVAGLLMFTTATSTSVWGLSPISTQFHKGVWEAHNSTSRQLHHILDLAPSQAGVSVAYILTPHVTHRRYAFEFPNPWINNYYGLKATDHGDPETVSWLLLDRALLGDREKQLLAQLTAPNGAFRIVYEDGGVLAAQRVRPGV
jgi:uncharacterized membrane protein